MTTWTATENRPMPVSGAAWPMVGEPRPAAQAGKQMGRPSGRWRG
ncbi:hypothetical protein [Dactylosporangium darangshiense]|jgi:hypothetical protein|nr:hypothetical protein [Dactylosporangium sp.]